MSDVNDKIDWSGVPDAPAGKSGGGKKVVDWCLPAGEYCVEIMGVDRHEAQDGRFVFSEVKLQVTNGDLKGRLAFLKFYSHHNDYPNLVKATMQKFRDLCIAIFGKQPVYYSELEGHKCFVTLGVREGGPKKDGTGNYPNSNQLESARSLSGPASAVVNIPEQQKVVAEFNDEIPW